MILRLPNVKVKRTTCYEKVALNSTKPDVDDDEIMALLKSKNLNNEKWQQKLVILPKNVKYALKLICIVALLQQNVKIMFLNIWLDRFN